MVQVRETRSTPEVRPLGHAVGAEVLGVDLAGPLSDDVFARILDAFHEHAVLVFRGQTLGPAELSRFSARFGPLEVHHMAERPFPDQPEVRVLSNVRKDGQPIGVNRGGRHWHSDLSYLPETALATFLHCVETPPVGGDTLFAAMHAAYDAMPDPLKRALAGRRAVHDRNFRYAELYPDRPPLGPQQIAKVPPTEHPLVVRHPVTGRPSLFLAKDVVSGIVGMDDAEGRPLIDELEAFATQDRFVYGHHWSVGDLVVWDNRCTLHRATGYDEAAHRRIMLRTQVKGTTPRPA